MKKLLLLLLLVSPLAMASPDEDAILTKIMMLQAAQLPNLAKLPDELKEMVKQNLNLKSIQADMYGDTGIENLLNGTTDMNARLWANNNWQDVLNAKGGSTFSQFQQEQQQYQQQFPVVTDASHISDNDLLQTYYQQNRRISRAALAASEHSYDTVNQHMQTIRTLISKLSASPTEKASVDMNARLLAEISYIQLEMLRQQNIQTQLMAMRNQGHVNGMSNQSQFLQWSNQ